MLLYPTVETDLQLHYELHGHRVSICTIDLSKDWRDIHSRLIDFVIGPELGVREFEEEEERWVEHESIDNPSAGGRGRTCASIWR